MRKVTISFTGQVTLNIEDDEETSLVMSECEVIHPDNTRVVDYTIENLEVIDSK
jgi:hypothetical protein